MNQKGFTPHYFSKRWIIESMRHKSGEGFTLIELIVSIAIIGLLTTLVFVNFRDSNDVLALDRAAQEVAQDVRTAGELALQANQAVSCGAGTLSGYGIYFDLNMPTAYLIFAECTGNDQYDAGQDLVVRNISLERNVEIVSVTPANPISVVFTPPDPAVTMSGGATSAQVIVALAGTTVTPDTYEESGTNFGWDTPRASCDTTTDDVECPSSFPATGSDPNVYDQFCSFSLFGICFLPFSEEYDLQSGGGGGGQQKTIHINQAGFPDVQ